MRMINKRHRIGRMNEATDRFDTICYSPYFEDDITLEDFILTITNESVFYQQTIKPTIDNLRRKVKSGRYDDTLALKAWQNVADAAVKFYDKKYGSKRGSLTLISKPIRMEIAQILKDEYDEGVFYNESVRRPIHKTSVRRQNESISRTHKRPIRRHR